MNQLAMFSSVLILSLTSSSAVAQKGHATSSAPLKAASRVDIDQAIETIATSPDIRRVNSADRLIRNGGLTSIQALLQHLNDKRHPPSNYLTRAVSGDLDMSDHVFWLIQDILEDHQSKLDATYSPLRKETVRKWVTQRKHHSLNELRRDACIGSFAVILKYADDYPTFNAAPVLTRYAQRLVKLDQKLQDGG